MRVGERRRRVVVISGATTSDYLRLSRQEVRPLMCQARGGELSSVAHRCGLRIGLSWRQIKENVVNWSHLNIWAPGRKLAAAIRGRAAALRRVPRRKVGPTASKVEPGFDRWHEYEPLDSDRPRTTRQDVRSVAFRTRLSVHATAVAM